MGRAPLDSLVVVVGGSLEENAYSASVPALDNQLCAQNNPQTSVLGSGQLCAGYSGQNIGLCRVRRYTTVSK